MNEILTQRARIYAARHHLRLSERLGFGIHGIVHVAEGNIKPGKSAIKVHHTTEPYLRERQAYERLQEAGVSQIRGFRVPHLIRCDDELRVIQMSIVTRPFVLDFAGAYLDAAPAFSDEIWAEWEVEKREQFAERWPLVLAVLSDLENLGIHMVDVSPSNIASLE